MVTIVSNKDDFCLTDKEWTFGEKVMVERFIPGRELTVTVMGDRPLAVTEIITENDFYNYGAKYSDGGSKHILPADLPKNVYQEALNVSLLAHQSLMCRGLSRVDLRYDGEKLFVLEVNTQPGMTPTSLAPEQAAYLNISFNELVTWLVEMQHLTLKVKHMIQSRKPNIEPKRGQPRRRVKPFWKKPVFILISIAIFFVGTFSSAMLVWDNKWFLGLIKKMKSDMIISTAKNGFTVREVLVEGRFETSREDLIKALGVEKGSPILEFNINVARRRLESLPWIRRALIQRQLPDVIHLLLSEHRPMAL